MGADELPPICGGCRAPIEWTVEAVTGLPLDLDPYSVPNGPLRATGNLRPYMGRLRVEVERCEDGDRQWHHRSCTVDRLPKSTREKSHGRTRR